MGLAADRNIPLLMQGTGFIIFVVQIPPDIREHAGFRYAGDKIRGIFNRRTASKIQVSMEGNEVRPQEAAEPVFVEKKSSGFLRFTTDILETLILAVFLFFVINMLSARIRVDGSSMEPTLHTGEFIIVDKVSYEIGSPQRGDVIVFHYPRNPEKEYIKRVIGLPGDVVDIANGQVSVNGQILQEPYIAASPTYPGNWIVKEDALFVLGDNRNNSDDSHRWGTVPLNYVIGRAVFIYWPPEQWGLIDHFKYNLAQ